MPARTWSSKGNTPLRLSLSFLLQSLEGRLSQNSLLRVLGPHTASSLLGMTMLCWGPKLGSFAGEPNEDGWPERPAPSGRTTERPGDSAWQGGDPDRCPQASGGRLLLTEAKWI